MAEATCSNVRRKASGSPSGPISANHMGMVSHSRVLGSWDRAAGQPAVGGTAAVSSDAGPPEATISVELPVATRVSVVAGSLPAT